MVSATEIERSTYYGTVGYIGEFKKFSWSVLEFKFGCSITVYIHEKNFKKRIATNAKWKNVPQLIADFINKIENEAGDGRKD